MGERGLHNKALYLLLRKEGLKDYSRSGGQNIQVITKPNCF